MSEYLIKYRIAFKNDERNSDLTENGQIIYIDISPVSSLGEGELSIWNLKPAANPLITKTINNDRDKLAEILSTQAIIQFIADDNFDMTTFADAGDNDWFVNIYTASGNLYQMYLVLADMSQAFLPKRIVTLTASDHLGVLKDIPLTDFDGSNPTDYNQIGKYIAWALRKTGLDLQLDVFMNIREQDFTDEHFYHSCYLNAKTFEDEIGTCVNCYQALKIILGKDCRLFQKNGRWVILRIDELDTQLMYQAVFTNGVFQNFIAGTAFNKAIGAGESIRSLADRIQEEDRPLKSVKLTYNYQYPKELPCNVDFSRGDLIDGSDPLSQKYDIECWEKLWSNTTTDDSEPTGIYVRKKYSLPGYETQRYVQIEVSAIHFRFILSEPIPVLAKDKLNISVDRRLDSDDGSSGFFRDTTVIIRLYGNGGNYYTHHGKTSVDPKAYWVSTASNFRPSEFHVLEGDISEDQRESKDLYDGDVAEIPEDGYIRIALYASAIWGPTKDTYIDRLSVDYKAFVNGSYEKYTGQSHLVQRSSDKFLAKREEEIFMSDSPNPNFKGALFKLAAGPSYVLTGTFYNAAVFNTGPPTSEFFHPFGEIQIQSVWNQYRNANRIFTGTLRGLNSDELDGAGRVNHPSLLHKYFLTDTNPNTSNRYFILVDFEMNWKTCLWRGTFIEVYNVITGKVYDDEHIFKFIS